MFAALKDKKSLATIMKQNLCFKQLRLNYLNKQQKSKKITTVYAVSSVLEHLSHPFLVLLFYLLTGKCWLGKASLTFVKLIQWIKTLCQFKESKDLTGASLYNNFYVKKNWHERVLVLQIENNISQPKLLVFLQLGCKFNKSD